MGISQRKKRTLKKKKTRGTDVHTMGIQKSTTGGCRFGSDQPGRAKKGFNAAYEGGIGGISRKGAIVGQGSPRIDQGGIRPCKIWGGLKENPRPDDRAWVTMVRSWH